MRVLYVSTEVHPALKTGGLADVNAALPRALRAAGADVRLLLPAFPALLSAAVGPAAVVSLDHGPGNTGCRVLHALLGDVPTYLVDAPSLYAFAGLLVALGLIAAIVMARGSARLVPPSPLSQDQPES